MTPLNNRLDVADPTTWSAHTLIAVALTTGLARWEPFDSDPRVGEICADGMRYVSRCDSFGVPQLNPSSREVLQRLIFQQRRSTCPTA